MEYEIEIFPNYKSTDTKFVRVLKAVMFAKNLNQLQLAKKLGIRQSQCSNWINGKSQPTYYSLQQIKTKLDVCIEHFFD